MAVDTPSIPTSGSEEQAGTPKYLENALRQSISIVNHWNEPYHNAPARKVLIETDPKLNTDYNNDFSSDSPFSHQSWGEYLETQNITQLRSIATDHSKAPERYRKLSGHMALRKAFYKG